MEIINVYYKNNKARELYLDKNNLLNYLHNNEFILVDLVFPNITAITVTGADQAIIKYRELSNDRIMIFDKNNL